jgi:hypothetical protein
MHAAEYGRPQTQIPKFFGTQIGSLTLANFSLQVFSSISHKPAYASTEHCKILLLGLKKRTSFSRYFQCGKLASKIDMITPLNLVVAETTVFSLETPLTKSSLYFLDHALLQNSTTTAELAYSWLLHFSRITFPDPDSSFLVNPS